MPPDGAPEGDAPPPAMTTPTTTRTRQTGQHQFSRSGIGNAFRHSQNTRATQPTYNLITGRSASNSPAPSIGAGAGGRRAPSAADSTKENHNPHDADSHEAQRRRIEELRAEVAMLTYRSETARQEKDMAEARQAAALADQRRRADDEYERAKAADVERVHAERAAEQARDEAAQLRALLDAETARLDRRARDAEDEARVLQEQLDELASVRDEVERLAERERTDARLRADATQLAVRELEAERDAREQLVGALQREQREREDRVGALEAENIRLRAAAGDADTMAVIKRELSDQVAHIRQLEARDRERAAELGVLRQRARLTDVAEEEKRALQRQVAALERVQAELTEARIQRQRLEDERLAWAAYLGGSGDAELESLRGPEEVVRKLVEERLGRAQEVERAGALRAEMAALQGRVGALEKEREALQREVARGGGGAGGGGGGPTPKTAPDAKAVARLERQRALAVKEVEYLRLQLNSFDIEDAAFTPETHDAARGQRIAELEAIVDRYKDEVQALHAELLAAERQQQQPSSSSSPPHADIPPGSKRPRGEGAADVSAPPPAQLRALQDEAAALKAALALAQRDLASAHAQLAQLRESSKTRILALKSNPTADHEAVKRAALATLRRENADLLALARGQDPRSPTVPASVLDAALLDLDAARAHAASVEKTTRRLKEVWAAKSHEFREAVASTLGWSVSFMPNGKMRVESMYLCPPEGDAAGEDADEHANSIVFDGERGTMKVGGGPRSPFAARIAEQIGFWVRERGCVPGLLAALTIEFYEERMAREGR